jgi:tetratricopeptide (TPR) repeat protein
MSALDHAARGELHSNELIRLSDIVAERLIDERSYDLALSIIDEHITPDAASARLWIRRGIALWHQHDFAGAYSSLSVGLTVTRNRAAVTLWRGQVLAEWGRFAEAVKDLDEAIPESPGILPLLEEVCARSARVYALLSLGATQRADEDTLLLPPGETHSAWLHYFRGLRHQRESAYDKMMASFRDALKAGQPRLTVGMLDVIASIAAERMDAELQEAAWSYIPGGSNVRARHAQLKASNANEKERH